MSPPYGGARTSSPSSPHSKCATYLSCRPSHAAAMTLNKAAPLRPPSFHTGSSFHLPPLLPDPSPNASSSIPPPPYLQCALVAVHVRRRRRRATLCMSTSLRSLEMRAASFWLRHPQANLRGGETEDYHRRLTSAWMPAWMAVTDGLVALASNRFVRRLAASSKQMLRRHAHSECLVQAAAMQGQEPPK